MPTLLIVTVGGSVPPIIQAIEDYAPAQVVFVTSTHTATNSTSSTPQVNDEILPHFVGSQEFTHQIVEVNLDDLMDVYTKCCAVIRQYIAQYDIVADYTGGSKTMSSGLVLAARQYPKVALSLVSGIRRQMAAVYKAPVTAVRQQLSALHGEEQIRSIAMLVDMYEYKAATESANRFLKANELNQHQRAWWLQFANVLQGYAFWDNFEHAKAFETLTEFLAANDKPRSNNLLAITGKAKPTGYELVHDLLSNAMRRALQGRYDDATARVYRALEAFAQARLRGEYEADTSKISQTLIQQYAKYPLPPKFATGDIEAGMFNAYELLELFDDTAGKCWKKHRSSILNSIQTRNNSILAHGYTPVSKTNYEAFRKAVDDLFGAIVGAKIKIGQAPPNLPKAKELFEQLPPQ